MKTKLAVLSALFAGFSCLIGEIEVNEFFSIEGFADVSYTYLDRENKFSGATGINQTKEAFSLEEVELTLLLDFEPLSARIDIEYEDGDDGLDIEQAYVDYNFENSFEGSALTVGRYASMLGFEAYEPTGLYQYSNAYGGILGESIGQALSGVASDPRVARDTDLLVFYDSIFFPVAERYSQGIKYTFENEETFLGLSLQDSTVSYGNRLRGDDDFDDMAVDDAGYGFEIAYSYDYMRIITFFLGGAYEIGDGIDSFDISVGDTQTYTLNSYVTCQLGAWLMAAEINLSETQIDDFLDSGADAEVESVTGLLMANYAYNEKASVTGRISYTKLDADGGTATSTSDGYALKYTVAHNYALIENLFLVTELSYISGDFDSISSAGGNVEEILLATEMLFTF